MLNNYINFGRKSKSAKDVNADAAKIQGMAADATNKALAESGVPPGATSTTDGKQCTLKVIVTQTGKLVVAESPLYPLIEMAESCGDIALLTSFKDTLTKLLINSGDSESKYFLALLRKNDKAIENVQKHNHNNSKYNFGDVQNLNIGDVNIGKK